MSRTIKSWEYLYAGLVFLIGGCAVFLSFSWSGSTFGGPLVFVFFPFGILILAIGIYFLWKFDVLHKKETTAKAVGPAPR